MKDSYNCPACGRTMVREDHGTYITYTCSAREDDHVNTLKYGKGEQYREYQKLKERLNPARVELEKKYDTALFWNAPIDGWSAYLSVLKFIPPEKFRELSEDLNKLGFTYIPRQGFVYGGNTHA